MNNACNMDNDKLQKIISKFQMPNGEYEVIKNGEFGESEFYWIIQNKNNGAKFLLMNTYWHPGVEKEMAFYKENGMCKWHIYYKIQKLRIGKDGETISLAYKRNNVCP